MCAIKPIAAKLRSSYYLEQKGNLSALQSRIPSGEEEWLSGILDKQKETKNTEEI